MVAFLVPRAISLGPQNSVSIEVIMSIDLKSNTTAALADTALQDDSRADFLADPLSSASALSDSLDDGGDVVQMCKIATSPDIKADDVDFGGFR